MAATPSSLWRAAHGWHDSSAVSVLPIRCARCGALRADSGAVRLWQWARARRSSWTASEAAEAAELTPRRAREIVAAMRDAGLLDQVAEPVLGERGLMPAEYRVSAAGRGRDGAPILVVDGDTGRVTAVRFAAPAEPANDRLRAAVAASGLSIRAAAGRLGLSDRTLRRMLAGDLPIAPDDPVLARAGALGPPLGRPPRRA